MRNLLVRLYPFVLLQVSAINLLLVRVFKLTVALTKMFHLSLTIDFIPMLQLASQPFCQIVLNTFLLDSSL